MNTLTGRTALVTGGSRGIGRAVALRLAGDGALVAIHYGVGRNAAEETVREINDNGGRAFTVQADLATPDATDRLFEQLDVVLGGKGLDILVNGTGIGSPDPVADEFDRVFTVNVRTPFLVTRRALPMLDRGGRIINIAPAIAAPGQAAATMSRAALDAMAPALAGELGRHGITVNTIAPGGAADIADIADIAAYLAGPDAAFITGRTVNGDRSIPVRP